MVSQPLVTVICTCYNHEAFVIETLQSAYSQTHKNTEIIIVDDFSTDNSVKVIEQWLLKKPEVVFIKNTQNIGNTKSFNKAVSQSKGSFLIDLSCDDLLHPNTIAEQLDAFSKHDLEETAIVYGNAENIDENGNFVSYYFSVNEKLQTTAPPPSGNIYKQLLKGGTSMCSVSAMINRTLFEKLGGYDEDLAYEDLDYWIRASRNYKVYYEDKIWVKKRILSNSLGSNFSKKKQYSQKMTASTLKILRKAFHLNQNKEEDQALLKRVHYELTQTLNRKDYFHFVQYIWFKIKLQSRKF